MPCTIGADRGRDMPRVVRLRIWTSQSERIECDTTALRCQKSRIHSEIALKPSCVCDHWHQMEICPSRFIAKAEFIILRAPCQCLFQSAERDADPVMIPRKYSLIARNEMLSKVFADAIIA